MRDITTELKDLRLHGMAGAGADLTSQEGMPCDVGVQTSRWLIEHLLQAEHAQRAVASVRHQMKAARFPLHRDLAGFDFEASRVDQKLVKQLSTLEFTGTAQNAVLIGGPGTGKTHLATAIGVSGIATKGKRVRFYSTVDLVNELEKEKREGKAGRIASGLSTNAICTNSMRFALTLYPTTTARKSARCVTTFNLETAVDRFLPRASPHGQ